MAKVIDLTEKLGLADKPRITIGDVELVVNDSARSMLRIMELSGGDAAPDPATLMEMCDLLFDEESLPALEALELSFDDYMTVLDAAITLITGDDGTDPGNATTPATT